MAELFVKYYTKIKDGTQSQKSPASCEPICMLKATEIFSRPR